MASSMKFKLFLLFLACAVITGNEQERECLETSEGFDYKGKMKHTKSGILCQRWDAVGDNAKNLVWKIYQDEPAAFPEKSLSAAENYCRNPKTTNPQGRENKPWCYTTIPNNPRWEYCNVPMCPTCNKESKEVVERAICTHGTRRILQITGKEKSRFHCEEEQKVYYKSCVDEKECNEPVTTVGQCDGNVREIKTTYSVLNSLSGQCIEKSEVERQVCKDTICTADKMDVIIVMDSSHSIGRDNFLLQKKFIKEMVAKMKIDINGVRIGIIQYSLNVEIVVQLNGDNNVKTISQQIDSMEWMSSLTYTGLALNKAWEILRTQRRPKVPATIIVITDGNSNDKINQKNAIKESVNLKNSGVTVKVVAIGKEVKMEEIKAMVSFPLEENIYQMKDFEALHNWAATISKDTCTDVIKPSPSLCSLKPIRMISDCYRGVQSITEVEYVKVEEDNSCQMMIKSKFLEFCNYVCHDSTTGKQYAEREEWVTKCHKFICKRLNPTDPLLPIETGCMDANDGCHKPNQAETFKCKDAKGDVHDNCVCTMDANLNTFTTINWKI